MSSGVSSPTSSNPLAALGSSPGAAPSSALGKEQFVKLLMAQLGNQDPTSPMDSQAFVAQLAQFANVELLQSANTHLEGLMMAQAATNQVATAQLLGKDVDFRTRQIQLPEAGNVSGSARLSASAAEVTVLIQDESGRTVRSLSLGAHPAGPLAWSWDGLDDRGARQKPGAYRVKLVAGDSEGRSVEVAPEGRGRVTGVSFDNGYPELLVGAQRLPLSDVIAFHDTTASEVLP